MQTQQDNDASGQWTLVGGQDLSSAS